VDSLPLEDGARFLQKGSPRFLVKKVVLSQVLLDALQPLLALYNYLFSEALEAGFAIFQDVLYAQVVGSHPQLPAGFENDVSSAQALGAKSSHLLVKDPVLVYFETFVVSAQAQEVNSQS